MKKAIPVFLFAIFCGCQSESHFAASQSESSSFLIAATQDTFLQTALSHQLTPADVDRLERSYPLTLEKIQKYRNLNMQDIINLTKAGVADDVIIHEIRATRSTFFLTPADEQELSQTGVSRKVIRSMKDTIDDRY